MAVHELSRLDARRIAVRAQRLDRARPTELLDVVRQLTLLQIDPTAAIAPSADLVAWSRLESSYSPAELLAWSRSSVAWSGSPPWSSAAGALMVAIWRARSPGRTVPAVP